MRTPENARQGQSPATAPGNGWPGLVADAKHCFVLFARFGMGFSPELIAPHDALRDDDLTALVRKSNSRASTHLVGPVATTAAATRYDASTQGTS